MQSVSFRITLVIYSVTQKLQEEIWESYLKDEKFPEWYQNVNTLNWERLIMYSSSPVLTRGNFLIFGMYQTSQKSFNKYRMQQQGLWLWQTASHYPNPDSSLSDPC